MKGRLALISLLSLVILIAIAGMVTGTTSTDLTNSTTNHDVLTDTAQLDSLEKDHHMLEQMRTAVVASAGARNDTLPMWTDSDVVRAQEQYEAQIDRMIGRRPGRP